MTTTDAMAGGQATVASIKGQHSEDGCKQGASDVQRDIASSPVSFNRLFFILAHSDETSPNFLSFVFFPPLCCAL